MQNPVVAQSMTNGETIMASAEIAAPPERVFNALITDEVERWWGSSESYRMVDWTADLRVGQPGIEQQYPLGMHHQKAGIGKIGIGYILAVEPEPFRLVGDDGAAIEHIEPHIADLWRQRQSGRNSLGRYGPATRQ